MSPSPEPGGIEDLSMIGPAGAKVVSRAGTLMTIVLLILCIFLTSLCSMVFYVFTSPFCFVFHILFLLGENIEIIL